VGIRGGEQLGWQHCWRESVTPTVVTGNRLPRRSPACESRPSTVATSCTPHVPGSMH